SLARAIEADPESAFGGVIVLNKVLNLKAARIIAQFKDERRGNIDIVAAPKVEKNALELLGRVRKSMGIYEVGNLPKPDKNTMNIKWVDDGFILQTQDVYSNGDFKKWEIPTKKKPTK